MEDQLRELQGQFQTVYWAEAAIQAGEVNWHLPAGAATLAGTARSGVAVAEGGTEQGGAQGTAVHGHQQAVTQLTEKASKDDGGTEVWGERKEWRMWNREKAVLEVSVKIANKDDDIKYGRQ